MVNAAAAHVVEQDDVHNGSVFHPPPWCSAGLRYEDSRAGAAARRGPAAGRLPPSWPAPRRAASDRACRSRPGRPSEVLITRRHHAVRGHGQRRRRARGRAGTMCTTARCSTRRRGVPPALAVAQALGGTRPADRRRGRLRGRHPRRRILAVRTTRSSTPPAPPAPSPPPSPWAGCEPGRRADAARAGLGRHPGGRAMGIPARRRRLSSCTPPQPPPTA